ncbi:hypothetical protein WHR41_01525 [Cladosporium halotolerans]|uniref:Aspartyl aminopeptidase n=1 Tax=Cladosporium halotolerans TaxID=1052096 RepID=A0AB34KZE9_9PEZI
MVRNMPSMQSLRHNMEDMSFDAPPKRTLYQESTEPSPSQDSAKMTQLPSHHNPIVQLCGSDEYTKQLMNKVATGVATEAEQREFAQQVQRGLPGAPRTSPRAGPNSHLQDYHVQQELLRRQKQRRMDMARQETESTRSWRDVAHLRQATRENAAEYTKPFCQFLTDNPTVFHCVHAVKKQLRANGFEEVSERDAWKISPGGKYFVERNGSALMAFSVGGKYKPGNGAAILAGHVDALTAKLKPVSKVPNKAGYVQLGVAPYAGAPNTTWWDRDLGIGGRVLVKEGDKIVSKLVKLDWPIARIPTLAPHFGAAAQGPFNPETQMVPIIGLEDSEEHDGNADPFSKPPLVGSTSGQATTFTATQPPRLVRVIANELGIKASNYSDIVNWELELFDVQPATVGGIDKEFIFAGRVDDKLCSWAAIQALIEADATDNVDSSIIKAVGLFDNEEIGSLLRQGARGNFLPSVLERAVTSLNNDVSSTSIMGQTYANSFLVSSDVIHAVNPNFLNAYLENHSPHLNTGIVVSADSNGHMTTDSVSTAILQRCADKVGAKLQLFQIRNDSRSGGTVGPMLSSATGIRAIDCGIPQLSMHSVRATTGSLDPGLGVMAFLGFLNEFESVDKEFR